MEEYKLIDNNVRGLLGIMEDLSKANRRIAVVYNSIYGDGHELEENSDFLETQKYIQSAIRQVGNILGSNLAEKFF